MTLINRIKAWINPTPADPSPEPQEKPKPKAKRKPKRFVTNPRNEAIENVIGPQLRTTWERFCFRINRIIRHQTWKAQHEDRAGKSWHV